MTNTKFITDSTILERNDHCCKKSIVTLLEAKAEIKKLFNVYPKHEQESAMNSFIYAIKSEGYYNSGTFDFTLIKI